MTVATAQAESRVYVPGRSESLALAAVTERVCDIIERPKGRAFLLLTLFAGSLAVLLASMLLRLVERGIGVWGNSQSVGWAWDIAGFVFWIGIGHAGTLISAVLYLFRQRWRTSINRAAEAVTLFAVMTAAVYPVFHLGRVWLSYWLFPAPNQMRVWPNFKSPLTWDVFAISTYFLVSAMFWYLGLIPDLATLRDRAQSQGRRRVLALLALGWRNSQRHWQYHERAYLLLAALATPLVVSVHTIVSFDFAVSILPGWHSTLFPPYFVAGAILSGSAMLGALLVLVRKWYSLEAYITLQHFDKLNKLILATGSMVATAYGIELFLAWYSGNAFEQSVIAGHRVGSGAPLYWLMLGCNVLLPQLFWSRRMRVSPTATLLIGIGINVGMWLERFVIVVGSLSRGFIPSTWTDFSPTFVDCLTLAGTVGLFLSLFLLFLRSVPVLSIGEVKADFVDARAASARVEAQAEDDSYIAGAGATFTEAAKSERMTVALRALAQDSARLTKGRTGRRLILGTCLNERHLRTTCRQLFGLYHFDVHAPYFIHGLGRVLKEDTSRLAWATGVAGFLGAALAMGLQYWAQAVLYPMQLGGKPAWSWPSAVPVTFEISILFAAVGCFGAFLCCTEIPRPRHPLLACEAFRSATDDGYFISLEVDDDACSSARQALASVGVKCVGGPTA
ncbi:MAG TPA: quinol:electron acceptor oxidoreductase subunit ActD [Polyangiaceae bacterium]